MVQNAGILNIAIKTDSKTYEKMENWLYITGGIQHLIADQIGCKIHIDTDYKLQFGSFALHGMGAMYNDLLELMNGINERNGGTICIFVC